MGEVKKINIKIEPIIFTTARPILKSVSQTC